MAKRYILWDHDGVLVETEPWYFEATRQCIKPLGVELTQEQYLVDMAVGGTAWDLARALGATETAIVEHRTQRDALYQHFLQQQDIEIPGVVQTLRTLAQNYAMAIVTTAKRTDFDLIHRNRNIVSYMQFVLANGDYARSKPAPDPYLAALARFAAKPANAIAVEDSQRGLAAAVAAGLDCVVVANDFVRGQDLSAATHRIETLAELPALLASLE